MENLFNFSPQTIMKIVRDAAIMQAALKRIRDDPSAVQPFQIAQEALEAIQKPLK